MACARLPGLPFVGSCEHSHLVLDLPVRYSAVATASWTLSASNRGKRTRQDKNFNIQNESASTNMHALSHSPDSLL